MTALSERVTVAENDRARRVKQALQLSEKASHTAIA